MATSNSSPSGFSYAQAAKGRSTTGTTQAASSKNNSGTTPSGSLADLAPTSNWADDVEASVGDKSAESQKESQEGAKTAQLKENAVDRTKSEDKTQRTVSGVSSPDLPTSASMTTKEDDSSSAPNGSSSETTWETKSQASEPAWIAERKERQSSSQTSENTVKGDKKKKEKQSRSPSPVKPAVLHEAPPPSVNPWAKRAEENKGKVVVTPKPLAQHTSEASAPKENHPPRGDTRKKTSPAASAPRDAHSGEEAKKPAAPTGRRGQDSRINAKATPKHQSDETHSTPASTSMPRSSGTARQASLPTTLPPSVKDETLWPTPDSALEKDKKDAPRKGSEEKHDDDTPTTKRKKPEWQAIPVQHSVIWETPSMNEPKGKSRPPGGERGGRGGSTRGRGNFRGAPNGIGGGDRQAGRAAASNQEVEASAVNGRAVGTSREAGSPMTEGTVSPTKGDQNSVPTKAPADAATTKPAAEVPRARSPRKQSAADVPKPIPQRTAGTQTEETSGGADNVARDGVSSAQAPSETRKESRNFDGYRDSNWSGSRGSKRGGRGRGGNGAREMANGHPASHAYANSFQSDFAGMVYGGPVPSSPYPASRGNHQHGYSAQGRGNWRGNPRSQSIPIENNNYYARFQPFSGAQGQMPPAQSYVPGMYDLNGMPMSAVPYAPHVEQQYLMDMVSTQLEYYFSIDNLLKDMFLRKQMDSQGFVFLDVIANFNRIKQLTGDKDVLKAVCINSEHIEIRVGEDGKERIRKREGWDQFLLPMDQRDAIAQTEGSKQLERPERPQLSMNNPAQHFRGPYSAGIPFMHQRYDRRSYDSGYPSMNGFASPMSPYGAAPGSMYGDMTSGEEMRGRATKSPVNENSMSPHQHAPGALDQANFEPDNFPDEQISVLTVVVKMNQQKPASHPQPSRTFSNGSIDSKSIEMEKPKDAQSTPNGEVQPNGTDSTPSQSRNASPNTARGSDQTLTNSENRDVYWVKDHEVPVDNLPTDLIPEPYVQLRLKALDQRNHASTGTCPYDLKVLYQFWCHFLIRNFNNRMYSEFKYFANEDAKERRNLTGLQNLIKYYSEALASHNPIRDRVVRDYVELVKNEPPKLEGAAFKNLRAAWRNGALNLKNRKKMADVVDGALKEQLDKTDT